MQQTENKERIAAAMAVADAEEQEDAERFADEFCRPQTPRMGKSKRSPFQKMMTQRKDYPSLPDTPSHGRVIFIVKAYAFAHEPSLVSTHTSETSAFVEIESLKRRMKKHNGSISRTELIDCRPKGTLTNLDIHADTEIEWSWQHDEKRAAGRKE